MPATKMTHQTPHSRHRTTLAIVRKRCRNTISQISIVRQKRRRFRRWEIRNRKVMASTELDTLGDEHDLRSKSAVETNGSSSTSNTSSTSPRALKTSSYLISIQTELIQLVLASSLGLFGGDQQVYSSLQHHEFLAVPMPIECCSEKIINYEQISESPRQTSTRESVEGVMLQSTPHFNQRELQTSTHLSTTGTFGDQVPIACIHDSTWCESEMFSTQNES